MYYTEFDIYKFKFKNKRKPSLALIFIIPNILFLVAFIYFRNEEYRVYKMILAYTNFAMNTYFIFFSILRKVNGKIKLSNNYIKVRNKHNLAAENNNINEISSLIINISSYGEESVELYHTPNFWLDKTLHNYITFKNKNNKNRTIYFLLENSIDLRQLQWILRFWKENNIAFTYTYRGDEVDVMFEP